MYFKGYNYTYITRFIWFDPTQTMQSSTRFTGHGCCLLGGGGRQSPFLLALPSLFFMQPCRPWGAHRPLAIASRPCHVSPSIWSRAGGRAMVCGQASGSDKGGMHASASGLQEGKPRWPLPGGQRRLWVCRWQWATATGRQPAAMGQNRVSRVADRAFRRKPLLH